MKIIKSGWFPFGGYGTINLFEMLITRGPLPLPGRTLRHEGIHTAQMREMLYIFFYIWYGLEYLAIRLFHRTQNGTYRDVSFEEEAYAHEDDPDYLASRRPYAWFRYIRVRSNDKG